MESLIAVWKLKCLAYGLSHAQPPSPWIYYGYYGIRYIKSTCSTRCARKVTPQLLEDMRNIWSYWRLDYIDDQLHIFTYSIHMIIWYRYSHHKKRGRMLENAVFFGSFLRKSQDCASGFKHNSHSKDTKKEVKLWRWFFRRKTAGTLWVIPGILCCRFPLGGPWLTQRRWDHGAENGAEKVNEGVGKHSFRDTFLMNELYLRSPVNRASRTLVAKCMISNLWHII